MSFHPGRESAAPFEIVRLYLEAGGRADKCVMSHLDRTILDLDELLEFAKTGVYCQFDLFGTECSYYQLNPVVDMPSDAERMKHVVALCEHGLTERIMMSHDVHTKHRLVSGWFLLWGGCAGIYHTTRTHRSDLAVMVMRISSTTFCRV